MALETVVDPIPGSGPVSDNGANLDVSRFKQSARPTSSCSRNETGNAGFHYCIQALSGLNAIDFVERVLRKRRDVEILFRPGGTLGRGKQSCAALDRPSKQDLRRRLSNSSGDSRNDWILEQSRLHPVA